MAKEDPIIEAHRRMVTALCSDLEMAETHDIRLLAAALLIAEKLERICEATWEAG